MAWLRPSTLIPCAAIALVLIAATPRTGQAAEPDAAAPFSAALRQKYRRPAAPEFPASNPYTAEREALGRTLFFDPRLSGSQFLSCASCHNPGLAWGDGLPKGLGHGMKTLPRRTPTILNAAFADLLFWDGRAESLEEQALGPMKSAAEMNMSPDQAAANLSAIPEYRALFQKAYPGEAVSGQTIAKALATFERTIVSEPAPFDRWIDGEEQAVSPEVKRGFLLFNGKAGCAQCHSGWNFTDSGFHDIGVNDSDLGRGALLKIEAMQHAFKTPTLRNAQRRAPYMHNGSELTLQEVIEFYDQGGKAQRASLAPEMRPLRLTSGEKADLLAFLQSLTSSEKPTLLPLLPR